MKFVNRKIMQGENTIPYKAVIILGSGVTRIIDVLDNADPEILIIGDGEKTTLAKLLKYDQFEQLRGKITAKTNISILAHGMAKDGSHKLDDTTTEEFLEKIIQKADCSKVAMNIRLISCFGGAAKLPNNSAQGSTLTAFAEDDRPMFGNKYYKPLLLGDKTNSFRSVLDNILENANQTLTISTITSNNEQLRFVVRPPKEMLYNLDEIARYFDHERNKIIQEYNSKVPNHERLEVNSSIKPLLNDQGRPTKEALLMAKKWRARRFDYLMTDHNLVPISSETINNHNKEYNAIIETLHSMGSEKGELNRPTKQQQILKNLINAQSDVNTPPILWPVIRGNEADVEIFIKLGADINKKNVLGNTALHYSPNFKTTKLLIEKGCDVNAKNNQGISPLHKLIQVLSDDIYHESIILDNEKQEIAYLK